MSKIYITNDVITNKNLITTAQGNPAGGGGGAQALQTTLGKQTLDPKMASLYAVMQLILGQTVVANPTIDNLPPGGEQEILGAIKRKLDAQFAILPDRELLIDGIMAGINSWFRQTKGIKTTQ